MVIYNLTEGRATIQMVRRWLFTVKPEKFRFHPSNRHSTIAPHSLPSSQCDLAMSSYEQQILVSYSGQSQTWRCF